MMARLARKRLRRLALLVGFGASAFAPAAWAGPTPEEVALSEALFREGKELLRAGKYDEACPKLAESERLDPAGGTLITLGLCYEAAGKIATAWVVFGEALATAERDKRADRVKLSREHQAALEKRLSYITVKLGPSPSPGLALSLDGVPLSSAALGTAIPTDPGTHRLDISAKGFAPTFLDVILAQDGDRQTLVVPTLKPEPEAPKEPIAAEAPKEVPPAKPIVEVPNVVSVPEPRPVEQSSGWSLGRYASLGLGLVSAGAIGVGGYFSIQAKNAHDEALRRCPASPCPDDEGIARNEDAKRSADLATGFWIGGGVGLFAAGVLWVVSPKMQAPSKKTAIVPLLSAAPGQGFVGVRMSY